MQQNERNTALYEAILRLNSLDECIRFFDDLCAVTELRTMEQRYAVAGCLLWTPTHYDTLYGLQGAHEKAERHNAAALAALDALGPGADFLRLMAAELLERKK